MEGVVVSERSSSRGVRARSAGRRKATEELSRDRIDERANEVMQAQYDQLDRMKSFVKGYLAVQIEIKDHQDRIAQLSQEADRALVTLAEESGSAAMAARLLAGAGVTPAHVREAINRANGTGDSAGITNASSESGTSIEVVEVPSAPSTSEDDQNSSSM